MTSSLSIDKEMHLLSARLYSPYLTPVEELTTTEPAPTSMPATCSLGERKDNEEPYKSQFQRLLNQWKSKTADVMISSTFRDIRGGMAGHRSPRNIAAAKTELDASKVVNQPAALETKPETQEERKVAIASRGQITDESQTLNESTTLSLETDSRTASRYSEGSILTNSSSGKTEVVNPFVNVLHSSANGSAPAAYFSPPASGAVGDGYSPPTLELVSHTDDAHDETSLSSYRSFISSRSYHESFYKAESSLYGDTDTYLNRAVDTNEDASSDDEVDGSEGQKGQAHTGEGVAGGQAVAVKNWNEEFQSLLELPMDSVEKYDRLCQLVHDFTYAATTYAKIIISELCLPVEQKTIKPKSMGGVAGGEKYVCQGIVFKFAVDTKISDDPPYWMYGGRAPNDEAAIKAAGLEFTGWLYLWDSSVRELHLPLMCLIDYKGYRVVAVSLLPLGPDTLRYGSADGGAHIHADDPKLNALFETAAERLNLCKHTPGTGTVAVWGPGDVEGHLGKDGRYYVLDFARLMPPEAPPESLEERKKNSRGVFYKLLRGELVGKAAKPLCSDAFTGWDAQDPEREKHEADVKELTKALYTDIIPGFAQKLEGMWERVLAEEAESMLAPIRHRLLAVANPILHSAGINARHLGRVRCHVKTAALRELILSVCVAKAVKNEIRERMREKMRRVMVPSEVPFYEVLLEMFNMLLGKTVSTEEMSTKETDYFWRQDIKIMLERRFEQVLTPEEASYDYDLRASIDFKYVFVALLDQLQVDLKKSALKQLVRDPSSFVFVESDLKALKVKVKLFYVVHFSGGLRRLLRAQQMKSESQEGAKKRLLASLHNDFQKIFVVEPNCVMTLYLWGTAVAMLAALEKKPEKADALYRYAYRLFAKGEAMYRGLVRLYDAWADALESHAALMTKLNNAEEARKLQALAQQHRARSQELRAERLGEGSLFMGKYACKRTMQHTESLEPPK